MKTNELMLGDLVTFKDCQMDKTPVIIEIMGIGYNDTLQEDDSACLVRIDGDKSCDIIEIDDEIVGIPLTPEILEKNGFDYEKTNDVWILECGEIIIEVGIYHPDFINVSYKQITPDGINEGNISSICKIDGSDIMTHELQHALRLCGISKEIVL